MILRSVTAIADTSGTPHPDTPAWATPLITPQRQHRPHRLPHGHRLGKDVDLNVPSTDLDTPGAASIYPLKACPRPNRAVHARLHTAGGVVNVLD
jgi:hypothetical protein